MHPAYIVVVALCLSNCARDETVAAYGGANRVWTLAELDGQRIDTRSTLTFAGKGQIFGHGPCNAYTADMPDPYPWFETGRIARTKTACPDLATEERYFEVLASMTQSEVSGPTLVLRNNSGQELVFIARD